jgi:hypothetical protein
MKPVLRSGLAAIQALLLLSLQLAEGTGVHRCPEHDAGVGISPASADHHGHQGHQDQKGHSGCHCLGPCCQAALLYVGSRAPNLHQPVQIAARPETRAVTSLRSIVRLLPFALGPPRIA